MTLFCFCYFSAQNYMTTIVSQTCYIKVGFNWGSGVSLDADRNVFLTCSHVLKGSESYAGM